MFLKDDDVLEEQEKQCKVVVLCLSHKVLCGSAEVSLLSWALVTHLPAVLPSVLRAWVGDGRPSVSCGLLFSV